MIKRLGIKGMTCASCSARIEKVVGRVANIENVSVNLATEVLSYSSENDIDEIVKGHIERLGFGWYELTEKKKDNQEDKKRELKIFKVRLIIALLFSTPLLYIAMAPMISINGFTLPSFITPSDGISFAIVQLVMTIPVMATGYSFYVVGFRSLFRGSPNMDSLIAIGTSAAFIYSIYSTIQLAQGDMHAAHNLYFESSAVIIALITVGKYLEARSKNRTGDAIRRLIDLTPKTATVIINGVEHETPIDLVKLNDLVVIKPGTSIPVDGTVVSGRSSVNESMLTGESVPVDKGEGDKVFAASMNSNGLLIIKTTGVGEDTALSRIIKLVEQAQGSKAPIAKIADTVSGYFVPIVMCIAVISSVLWFISGESITFSLSIFISVLVIACPCALGLATPTAIMVSTGKGAENGILIKSGEALETAHSINTVVLDKTGTITQGNPVLTDVITFNNYTEEEVVSLAASAEMGSEHPLGVAIVKHAKSKNIELKQVSDFSALTGYGVEANVSNKKLFIGNDKLMQLQNISLSVAEDKEQELSLKGKTPMFIAHGNILVGIIAVADTVKPSAANAVEKLKELGVDVLMVTGDNKNTAKAIADEVGINKILAEVLPQDKSAEIVKLKQEGRKVAMVGDGINDAPALVEADIGIAVGSGTDVAIDSADIVLVDSNPIDVVTAIKLSRKTIRNIKQNLFWAFAYNVAGIPLAAGVLYIFDGPLLNPMFAAAAMSLSSISVVSNALRLLRFRP